MIDATRVPRHIAIIMDGNGRWARERGFPRYAGHREGVMRVKEAVRACNELGVSVLTLFSFSTENWSRPRREVSMLMRYLENFLAKEIRELIKNDIRLRVIGRDDPIPGYLQKKLKEAQDCTSGNQRMTLVLALNYGARQEILDAVHKCLQDVDRGEISAAQIDEGRFGSYLYTHGLPDPDLLIRTSGEMRISNFLLWQLSYAEFYFVKKYWPDFRRDDLVDAIKEYQRRIRRFGGVNAEEKNT